MASFEDQKNLSIFETIWMDDNQQKGHVTSNTIYNVNKHSPVMFMVLIASFQFPSMDEKVWRYFPSINEWIYVLLKNRTSMYEYVHMFTHMFTVLLCQGSVRRCYVGQNCCLTTRGVNSTHTHEVRGVCVVCLQVLPFLSHMKTILHREKHN